MPPCMVTPIPNPELMPCLKVQFWWPRTYYKPVSVLSIIFYSHWRFPLEIYVVLNISAIFLINIDTESTSEHWAANTEQCAGSIVGLAAYFLVLSLKSG